MLKLILIITLGAPDVGAMERAYQQWLGYSVVERGTVAADLADAWASPAMRGRGYALLKPPSGAGIYLRFVQVDAPERYTPMQTFGWNAIELLVQDPDALAEQLRAPGSPFRIIGPPRPLGPNSPIRAMQVVGPASEVLYLTRVPPGPDRHVAQTFVDRPFIMIVGGRDFEALRRFYGETLGLAVGPAMQARMTVLNKAHGLDVETTHPLSMARLSPEYGIEIDGYPESASVRPQRPHELPPAIATVGFEVDSLEDTKLELISAPRTVAAVPYDGRRVAVTRGPAGELLELIEKGRPGSR